MTKPNLLAVGDSPFTIHNIPFGIISTKTNTSQRCATAIGDFAIDLASFAATGRLDAILPEGSSAVDIFSKARVGLSLTCSTESC
jgi:fumarylacetoacetase